MEHPQTVISSPCLPILHSNPEPIFEEAMVQAVNDILSALGESSKQAIYSHLKNRYGIDADEIPSKIEAFANALEETFGSVGKVIEIKIIERLHTQYTDFRYTPQNGELDFAEYIINLRNSFDP